MWNLDVLRAEIAREFWAPSLWAQCADRVFDRRLIKLEHARAPERLAVERARVRARTATEEGRAAERERAQDRKESMYAQQAEYRKANRDKINAARRKRRALVQNGDRVAATEDVTPGVIPLAALVRDGRIIPREDPPL